MSINKKYCKFNKKNKKENLEAQSIKTFQNLMKKWRGKPIICSFIEDNNPLKPS